MQRMAGRMRASVLLGAAAGALAVGGPGHLHGDRLGDHTGLRLVVAGKPPFVLDVDSGYVTRLSTIGNTYDVIGVSADAAVVVAGPGTPVNNKLVYAVTSGAAPALIGSARDIVAAQGAGIWVTRIVRRGHCSLSRIGLDARHSAPRALPCNWIIAPAGTLGLVVRRTRIIDPRTSQKVYGTRQGVLAVAGARVLTGPGTTRAPGYRFTLLDTVTGARHRLPWPSALAEMETPQVDPGGRYVALPFGDPSWHDTGRQVLDVWVLNTATARLTHLPATPAYVSLKRTSIAWTHDGRLVLLGEEDERAFVGVWRPGEKRLSLKAVRLPVRDGATDAFAPIR
jgi:hypothetical protein